MNRRRTILKLFPILLLAIILIAGYRQKDELYQLLRHTRLNWFLLGLLFYFFNYITRASRLQLLAGRGQFSFITGLKTSSLHGYYSYFLPFRSGDISLPILLKRLSTLPLATGSALLVRARLLDMVSLGLLLFSSSLLSFSKLDRTIFLFFLLASTTLVGTPLLIKLAIRKGKDMGSQWIKDFSRGINHHPMNLKETSLSLLIWFWTGCTLFSVTRALAIPIQFMDIWFLVAIQLPLQLFPIQGVANTGNHEVGWVTGFTLLGIPPEKGLDFALASHLLIIGYVLLLGIMGFLIPEQPSYSSTRS